MNKLKVVSVCSKCGSAPEKIKSCGNCNAITYCSIKCQREDWIDHKSKCSSMSTNKSVRKLVFPWTDAMCKTSRFQSLLPLLKGKRLIVALKIKEKQLLSNDFNADINIHRDTDFVALPKYDKVWRNSIETYNEHRALCIYICVEARNDTGFHTFHFVNFSQIRKPEKLDEDLGVEIPERFDLGLEVD
jgi:hypothetical protein